MAAGGTEGHRFNVTVSEFVSSSADSWGTDSNTPQGRLEGQGLFTVVSTVEALYVCVLPLYQKLNAPCGPLTEVIETPYDKQPGDRNKVEDGTWDADSSSPNAVHALLHPPLVIWNSGLEERN